MSLESAHQLRDKRLRRRLLDVLFAARTSPLGGISARMLHYTINSAIYGDQAIQDDPHGLELLIDLRDGGYVEMIDQRKRKIERWGMDTIFAKITDKGSRLVREEIPVDPAIEDERVG